jgi:meso-butanediol dehydrogenase/(S,S)-butanediol dehydrogenase/diacetyl reductase
MTPMGDKTCEVLANCQGKTQGDVWTDFAKNIPLDRVGYPNDVANLVSFLASKDSDYITGQSILINGGTDLS